MSFEALMIRVPERFRVPGAAVVSPGAAAAVVVVSPEAVAAVSRGALVPGALVLEVPQRSRDAKAVPLQPEAPVPGAPQRSRDAAAATARREAPIPGAPGTCRESKADMMLLQAAGSVEPRWQAGVAQRRAASILISDASAPSGR